MAGFSKMHCLSSSDLCLDRRFLVEQDWTGFGLATEPCRRFRAC